MPLLRKECPAFVSKHQEKFMKNSREKNPEESVTPSQYEFTHNKSLRAFSSLNS